MPSILTLQDQALWLARKRFGARKISKALDCHYITAANAVRKFERELRESSGADGGRAAGEQAGSPGCPIMERGER